MSLTSIQNVKTISGRKKILQEFLQNHPPGELTDEEDKQMKWLFETYYTAVDGQTKYPISDIDRFCISITDHSTKCFRIRRHDGIEDNTSIKYLAGEKRSDKDTLTRALRYTIGPQIEDFKRSNPLEPSAICPIQGIPLGTDAQVDHYNPTFQTLIEQWIKDNPKPKIMWGPRGSSIYLLEEPFQTSWVNFHQENANLRWLSKEGNKRAHLLNPPHNILPQSKG